MAFGLTERQKESAVEKMVENLAVLRTMLHLSQAEMAELIGLSRQTFVSIENRKRKMTWSVFLSLMFVFRENKETEPLLALFGIYSEELKAVYTDICSK